MNSEPTHPTFLCQEGQARQPLFHSTDPKTDDASYEYRPFACPFPGCSSTFKRKNTMKDHKNIHTGERPFVCPVRSCGKRFATSGNLGRHKRRLHPWLGKPLQCLVDGCQCEFPSDEKLKRHMLSHFDNSGSFRCDFDTCGLVFSSLGNLRRHMKLRHRDTTSVETVEDSQLSQQTFPSAEIDILSPLPYALSLSREWPSDHDFLETLSYLIDENKNEIDGVTEEHTYTPRHGCVW